MDEPENLRWVHCGEITAYLWVAQRAGVPLTDADADAYVDEQRRSAAVVGLDPTWVPGSVAELDDYFQSMLPVLRLTDEVKAAVRMWANTPAPVRLAPLKVIYPAFAALSLALVPGWARRLYGLPSGDFAPADAVLSSGATATLRATRMAMLAAPERYRGTELQMRYIAPARQLMRAGRLSAA
ncbi:MAG: DUF2236 domain-containing protein [Pseudonocardiales bacterium]|nr:DUF2236 domain-containing protein [Pseudonocardiales bacterium]